MGAARRGASGLRTATARRRLPRTRRRPRGARLPDDDLRRLADAAWWLGHVSECLALTEELPALPAGVCGAAVQAIDLAGMFFMRGEPALGSGWLSRARKLLADQPRGAGHDAHVCRPVRRAGNEQLDVATTGAARCSSSAELGRPDVRTWAPRGGPGWNGAAVCVRVSACWTRRCCRWSPIPWREFAGNIYCTIIAICEDIVDLARARQWTAATERWLESFTDAVMFQGVCRAHRAPAGHGRQLGQGRAEARQVMADLADLNNDAIAEAEYQRRPIGSRSR